MSVRTYPVMLGGPPPEYPCLMKSRRDDIIVLLRKAGWGTVVEAGTGQYCVGEYREDWLMENLLPFYGSVTIENRP